jgi:hypothetical protein
VVDTILVAERCVADALARLAVAEERAVADALRCRAVAVERAVAAALGRRAVTEECRVAAALGRRAVTEECRVTALGGGLTVVAEQSAADAAARLRRGPGHNRDSEEQCYEYPHEKSPVSVVHVLTAQQRSDLFEHQRICDELLHAAGPPELSPHFGG